MSMNATTITARPVQTVSTSQLEAIKSAIRAAAEANPSRYQDKGQRCAEFTRTVCCQFRYLDRLADLPAEDFPRALQIVAELAKPVRWNWTA